MTNVAGHDLPEILADAIAVGAWPPIVDQQDIVRVFGEVPEPSFALYSLDEMIGETSRWQVETDPVYLGVGDETLIPSASVLIGDLGYDRPFGIDLRSDPPCIRLLAIDGRWRLVAESVEVLLVRLGVGE